MVSRFAAALVALHCCSVTVALPQAACDADADADADGPVPLGVALLQQTRGLSGRPVDLQEEEEAALGDGGGAVELLQLGQTHSADLEEAAEGPEEVAVASLASTRGEGAAADEPPAAGAAEREGVDAPPAADASEPAADEQPAEPAAGPPQPVAQIAPFGREDTAQELQSHAARTQDTLVDAVENAEVAEIKRSVFRALTRLRAAEIKEFDTIARLETQAIDEYNDDHHYRVENPLEHLASAEPPVPEDKFSSFHD